ncbi:hypothetical protein EMIT0P258_50021 [Pseudomonas sp. IT-P258]
MRQTRALRVAEPFSRVRLCPVNRSVVQGVALFSTVSFAQGHAYVRSGQYRAVRSADPHGVPRL